MSTMNVGDIAQFEGSLNSALTWRAEDVGVTLSSQQPSDKFQELIRALYKQGGPVAVLIDEYDKPILDKIGNLEAAESMREALRGFYTVLKGCDEYLRFVMLTGISKFTKTGKPCGFVTIEDFEGSGEMAFFGEEWGRWRGMLTEGCIVYIMAKCQKRHRDSDYYELRVQDIQYMQTIKDTRLEKITLSIDSAELTEAVVTDLSTLVEKAPGKVQLYVQVVDSVHNVSLMLKWYLHYLGDRCFEFLIFDKKQPLFNDKKGSSSFQSFIISCPSKSVALLRGMPTKLF